MDPNPGTFPILSYVMSRLPSIGPRTAATASDSDQFDIEQPRAPPPSDPSSSSSGFHQPEIVDQMPHLADPKLLAAMARVISDVSQARSVLNLIGPRPTHEDVDNARAKLADVEAHLSRQLEEIVLLPRPAEIDIHGWRAHQAEKERQCRESAEKEKQVFKSVVQLEEMHDAYEKLLKDAEKRLVKIYESAEDGGGDDGRDKDGGDEVNEEVVGILQEAYGKGMERVCLSGRGLRLLPEAFGRIPDLVVLDVSSNQLSQVLASIKGHKLIKFILGPDEVPPEFLTAEDEALGIVNSAFLLWDQQDQLLLSWLLSSLSDAMLTRMVGCLKSWQLWEQIHMFFNSHTRAKVHQRQYRSELRNTKKGSKSISEYLLRIKTLVDSLISVGNPISVQEHIEVILHGLPEEFDSFVTSVTSRLDPYTLGEIESLLLLHEARLEKHHKDFVRDALSANVAHTTATPKSQHSDFYGSHQSNFVASSHQQSHGYGVQSTQNQFQYNVPTSQYHSHYQNDVPPGFSSQRPSFYGSRGGRTGFFARSRGRGRFHNNRASIVCQLCRKPGHAATFCYFRYDSAYQVPSLFPAQFQHQASNSSQFQQPASTQYLPSYPTFYPSPQIPYASSRHHFRPTSNSFPASTTPSFQSPSAQFQGLAQAMVATPNLLNSPAWFPDSGATNHVTHDHHNLMERSSFPGTEQILMGNGQGNS